MQWWFGGGPEVDRHFSERFGDVLEQARRGELDFWAQTPRGRLALIVVLDQFSRNVYRGSPLSYAQDEKALELAVEGIGAGMDRELTPMERIFFWMPLWATRRIQPFRSAASAMQSRRRPALLPTCTRRLSSGSLRPGGPAT